MTPVQLKALQRYVSAVAYFMLRHEAGQGNIQELLAAKAGLEAAFGKTFPDLLSPQQSAFPDIL